MVSLSVNLNKVALLRNSRKLDIPSPVHAAMLVLEAGADGITVHPRPDERHIRPSDVRDLSALLKSSWPAVELNIEGNPLHQLMDHVRTVRPQQCTFVPHVLVAPLGATVEVVNSDKALHQVRAQAGDFRLMNYAMPVPGHFVPTKLTKEGFFKVNCDVHPWMRAWLLVLPTTAYAVTGPEGTYRVADLPPGKHKVKFWHERLGERDAEIEIQPGRTAVHDVQYNPR